MAFNQQTMVEILLKIKGEKDVQSALDKLINTLSKTPSSASKVNGALSVVTGGLGKMASGVIRAINPLQVMYGVWINITRALSNKIAYGGLRAMEMSFKNLGRQIDETSLRSIS